MKEDSIIKINIYETKNIKTMKNHIKKHSNRMVQKIKNTRRKIKLEFILFLFAAFLILILSYSFFPQIKWVIRFTIETYGFIAVFFISYISDIIMQPIAPDLPIIIGIFFGLNPIFVTLSAIIASALATITGYYLGSRFGAKGFKKFYGDKKYKQIRKTYSKYRFVIPLAAISPIPYVPVCWISGMFNMNKIKFFLYAMIPRSLRLIIIAFAAYALFN